MKLFVKYPAVNICQTIFILFDTFDVPVISWWKYYTYKYTTHINIWAIIRYHSNSICLKAPIEIEINKNYNKDK